MSVDAVAALPVHNHRLGKLTASEDYSFSLGLALEMLQDKQISDFLFQLRASVPAKTNIACDNIIIVQQILNAASKQEDAGAIF